MMVCKQHNNVSKYGDVGRYCVLNSTVQIRFGQKDPD